MTIRDSERSVPSLTEFLADKIDDARNHQKYLERFYDSRILPTFVWFRLDGRHFSTLTKNITKPFSRTFSELMHRTAKDILDEFNPFAVYVGSDEISVAFTKLDMFGSRLQKLNSTLAGFTSSSFLMNCFKLSSDDGDRLWEESSKCPPHFDCRCIPCVTKNDFLEYLKVRMANVNRNAERAILSKYFKEFEIKRVSNKDGMVKLSEIGVNFEDIFKEHPEERFGAILMKVEVEKELDPRTLEKIPPLYRPIGPVMRREATAVSLKHFCKRLKEI